MGSLGGIPLDIGDVLAKKYRLERLVGQGGTGVVVAAKHLQLERTVAIKFLRTALASDEIRLRFEREARAIGQIESDHVVVVFDVGTLEDASPYMVMEYLDGRDLARILKEDGPLPCEDAVDCMLQVCEALAEAHAAGIVHRDLKPANLFLTHRDDGGLHLKVVDFGISKILDAKLLAGGPEEMTNAFTVLGSPRYMAPEQLRNSKDVDGRADLWSVGAVLFQLVTGKHAFEGDSNADASLAVLTREPRLLRHYASAPADLEAIVSKCLTKNVGQRFQTAAELAEALRPLASERTRESLDRMQAAREAPSVNIALNVASVSPASQAPPSGAHPEVFAEIHPRKIGGHPTMPSAFKTHSSRPPPPAPVTGSEGPPRRSMRPLGLVLGLALVAVVFVVTLLTGAKKAAEWMGFLSSPGSAPSAVPAPTVRGPSTAVTVTLDAGTLHP
jgi:serine/threonine-protein kinase